MHKPSLTTTPDDGLLIAPNQSFGHYWRDLWRYRELFYILSWRDVIVRYKQTVAGAAWAIVQPLVTMIIMTVVFGRIAGLPAPGGAPYSIMVFAAILPWQFFASALSSASQSVVGNANLVSKVYFPRLIIPTSPVLVSLIDFAVSALILAAMMIWFQFWPTWRILAIPGLVAMAILAALGPALIISALTVRYRDFRFIVPFAVQLGQYVSPVAYSSDLVRERFGDTAFVLYSLNPVVGVIDGFRWALLGGQASIYWPGFITSLVLASAVFAAGLAYFRNTERQFADLV